MKIGTIGSGFIVDHFINAVSFVDGVEIGACYSRNQEKAEEFAKKHNVSKAYSSLEEMFKDDDLDFIYVASPNSMHYPQTKQALLAGKNVICEKPFTSNDTELKDLIKIAKEKHAFLFEAIIPIHLPNYKWLKENINLVGDLKMIQCNFSQYSSKYDAFKRGENPNVFNTDFSGGSLMDINLYNIHFTMGLFGIPNNVQYFANIIEGIDTSGTVMMDYGTFKSTCVGAKDSKSKNSVQIQGDKGYILIESESSRVLQVECNFNNEKTIINFQDNPNGMYYEVKDFKEIVDKNDYETCYKLLDYSNEVMEVITQARATAGIIFKADNVIKF